MAPAGDAAERAKAIAAFFSRADETEFAEDKPFADLDGGLEGIISKLTSVDVSIKKFPVGTGKLAGVNLAYLVVRSEMTKTQLTDRARRLLGRGLPGEDVQELPGQRDQVP